MMNRWLSSIENGVFRTKEAVTLMVKAETGRFEAGFLFRLMQKAYFALLTCIFALGGATVGTITGAIKGHTTETGLVRGAGVGFVAGAITAIQLMELMINGEPFSKVALLHSLVNGKIFMEWVSPAVLKAYLWQISATETSSMEIPDIFEVTGTKGLSMDSIKKLPKCKIYSTETMGPCHDHGISCTICLRDFENGDFASILPNCRHSFHLDCIKGWLPRQGCCPNCRKDV